MTNWNRNRTLAALDAVGIERLAHTELISPLALGTAHQKSLSEVIATIRAIDDPVVVATIMKAASWGFPYSYSELHPEYLAHHVRSLESAVYILGNHVHHVLDKLAIRSTRFQDLSPDENDALSISHRRRGALAVNDR